jgi:hypothetical protein
MLAVVTVVALLLGWYGYRLAYVQFEARAIAGDWVMVDERGNTIAQPSGAPFRVTLNRDEFTIDPYAEPRQVDFYTTNGVSKAIYEWDHGRLRVLQASAGLERPRSFSDKITDLKAALPGTYSLTPFLLQRPK